jgi:hypothetical protein
MNIQKYFMACVGLFLGLEKAYWIMMPLVVIFMPIFIIKREEKI